MSLQVGNVCYSEAVGAKAAMDGLYPQIEATGTGTLATAPTYVSLTASSLVYTTGVYTFSTKNQAGTVLTTNGTMTFPTCTQGLAYDIPHGYIVIALVFAALFGWALGLRLFNSQR